MATAQLAAISLCSGVGMLSMKRRTGSNAKHGLALTPEYKAWQQMRLRCTDPTHHAYPAYGGRGIFVCARWLESVENFIADMGPKPSPAHELDRFPNNDGGYEPGNCRWATRSENARNRRSNRLVEHAGETLPLAAWAERYGITGQLIGKRIKLGWSVARAITTPARHVSPAGVQKKLSPCIACGTQCQGLRCRSCENERRKNGAS